MKIWKIGFAGVIALAWSVGPVSSAELRTNSPDENTPQIKVGTVLECSSGYLKLDALTLFTTPGTKLCSQSAKRIDLSNILEGSLVSFSYYRSGDKFIANAIKLMDQPDAGKHQKFTGKIHRVDENKFALGGKLFNIDEFTIRLGDTVRQDEFVQWRGVDVTVIAIKMDCGEWSAEVIREGLELTALAE